ncbi:hypothetical protein [Campylobacter blaseri]|uniref:hypothetical protein n=1 Tax=Campylobacter blaseri TaxID=2042961 RepID=UPI0019D4B243|nr:hypothetical protein [Campylobacter blaseri]
MTDSSTFKEAMKELRNIKPLFVGDEILINTYVAMTSDEPREIDEEFIKYLASHGGQEIKTKYGIKEYGLPLYEGVDYAKKYFKE